METAPPLDDMTAHYLAHHTAYGRSAKTIAHYQDTFKVFYRFLDERAITPNQRALSVSTFRQFATWLRATPLQRPRRGQRQRSEVGVHGILKDLRAFVRFLYKEGLRDAPVEVPVPKVPQLLFPILANEEMSRVWNSSYMTGRSSMAVRNRVLLGLMLDTGIRRAEVCGLTLRDVDFEQSHLKITGKGNKQRIVPFVANVKKLLLELAHMEWDRVARTAGRDLRGTVASAMVRDLEFSILQRQTEIAARGAEAQRREAVTFDSQQRLGEHEAMADIGLRIAGVQRRLDFEPSQEAEDSASRRRINERINDAQQEIAVLTAQAVVKAMGASSAETTVEAVRMVNEETTRIRNNNDLTEDDKHVHIQTLLQTLPQMLRGLRPQDV